MCVLIYIGREKERQKKDRHRHREGDRDGDREIERDRETDRDRDRHILESRKTNVGLETLRKIACPVSANARSRETATVIHCFAAYMYTDTQTHTTLSHIYQHNFSACLSIYFAQTQTRIISHHTLLVKLVLVL